ncbi:MAG: glycosyltransferase family 4 protein [Opitutales bacterium]
MTSASNGYQHCGTSLVLHPHHGGPYKTAMDFRNALGGKVYGFAQEHTTGETCANGLVEFIHTPNLLRISGTAYREARERIAAAGAKVISCHSLFRDHNNVTRKLARDLGIAYWVIPHGSMDPWVWRQQRLLKHAWMAVHGRRYFADATHVICATERERDKVRERYDGPNLRVVYWPVDPLDTSNQAEARASLRQDLGVPPQTRLLFYFGRYHTMKKPLETVQAFRRARLSERTHLVMAGIDYDVTQAQLQAAAGDNRQIHVLPAVYDQERLRLLIGVDAYISLSHRENYNYTAAESMTGGQAVILSPGNDLQHSLPRDERLGWRLQTDDPEEALQALKQFDATSDEAVRAMGERAQRWASTHLSFERFKQSLESLYREATA